MGRSVFLRALLPQDLKLDFGRLGRQEASDVAWSLAHVVGKAHGRQLAEGDRRSWLSALRRRSGTLDAPSWLWTSVVDLVALHDAAYLNHCRHYTLAKA
ncbi:DUF2252 family protein [Acetobacteraceae bacterium KSS8]|uniref:DUF2252 family protein n=1 Tax=Endosaccharibacter trunci TaxID=2812733 RepID=A0ABT1W954_9PROT|nr:DUF2252 family protein [Acetobacteraceae bacterium KSS8]